MSSSDQDPFTTIEKGPQIPPPPGGKRPLFRNPRKENDDDKRPKDEWKQLARAMLPWAAGALVLLATGVAISRSGKSDKKAEHVKKAKRKAKEAGEEAKAAVENAAEAGRHSWFGLRIKAKDTADKATDKAEAAKGVVSRKAEEARDTAYDAEGYMEGRVVEAKEGVKDTGRRLKDKAKDVGEAAKGSYRSAADSAAHIAHKVEEKASSAGSAALATASAGEEKVGETMKEAGERLEKDGGSAKRYFRGEQLLKEEGKEPGCSIM